jgi:CheY-like chemotaxis protein
MLSDYAYLYVEDDPFSREIMQMLMENVMDVRNLTIFDDSTNFVDQLKSLQPIPDVILLDIHVQPHSGFEMLKLVREDPTYQNSKVIALTASVMNEEVTKLRESGFDAAIAKPLSMQTFPEMIARVMSGETVWYVA